MSDLAAEIKADLARDVGTPGDPYIVRADTNYLLHISGGRTSGYMLHQMLEAYDGTLPPNVFPIFANTGKEREETLVFLDRMAERWGVHITWVEYTYRFTFPGGHGPKRQKNWFRQVGFDRRLYPVIYRGGRMNGTLTLLDRASRDGEPFRELIWSRKMLPNVVQRMCTEEMKVNTAERFARHVLGWTKPKPKSILGIRYDEPRRWKKALFEECRVVYPMVDARVSVEDVMGFWKRQPFDLGLRPDQGNCDLCFLKGLGKLKRLISEEPERADWWISMEHFRGAAQRAKHRKPEMMRFVKRYSYEEIRGMQMLPLQPGDEESISCFCAD